MKYLFLVFVQVFILTAVIAQTKKVIYTCSMDPEIRMDKPGNCSKCGMTLIKKTLKVAAPKPATQKKEEKPKPKQTSAVQQEKHNGVNTDKHRPQSKEEQQNNKFYTCVMHPEVQVHKPGTCPKCGMALIKKSIKAGSSKASQKEDAEMEVHKHHEQSSKTDEDLTKAYLAGKVNMQPGKTVSYHLYVTDTAVNYTGKTKHAYAINGTIPAPTLVFTEGDTAEIYLHNKLKEETSLHWHGVILPNRFDGVPYLTTKRIGPGETYLYKFRVVQNGTYWYHSHSALQEQSGMYGALVFKKRQGQDMDVSTTGTSENRQVDPGHQTKNIDTTARQNHVGHNMGGMDMPANHSMSMSPEPTKGKGDYNAEYIMVLSEWTDENPAQVQRRLRSANDWYAIKKGSVQSYGEAIKAGHVGTKLVNEWKRMKAMDVSDVYYDRFLINGKPETSAPEFKAGDKVKLRIVNAGASSYFWLNYAGGKITVVGSDGNDVQPIEVDRFIIGVAEIYDVVVTIPADGSFEFRATPEDRTKAASLWLGSGTKKPARKFSRLKYFEGMKMMNGMMKTNGDMNDMGMKMSLQKMDMNTVMYPEITGEPDGSDTMSTSSVKKDNMQHNHAAAQPADTMADMDMSSSSDIVTLNYSMLRSPEKTTLPDVPFKVLNFTLTGNMNRYVWAIDNKTVTEWDKILIEKGQNVRIILTNNSMMRHPMHLHGHDFRVVNGQGEYAPQKNVLDIMPMETDTLEFAANQSGDWFFHCHILYHMMAGMGNVMSYVNSPVNPDLPDPKKAWRSFKKDNNMLHAMAMVGLESNGSDGEVMLMGNRFELRTEWRIGTRMHHGLESETMFGRYFGRNQWLFPYVGFDYHRNKMENEAEKNVFGQLSNQNNRKTYTVGVQYMLPTMTIADARIDGAGKFRLQLSREDIPLTSRLRLNLMWNTDKEYMGGFRYIVNKWLGLSTHYDSDMGFGAGVTLNY
ncbi:MAG: multicopper oxidase type 3 [Segetibacter sp.]|nr:multicopper oxidase type 3 [Segetibacter sp.]